MGNKEQKAEKKRQKLKKKQDQLIRAGKLKRWKSSRPFWGATLTLLAGLLILYIPVQLYAIAFAPGSFAFVGLLFGGLIVLIGVMTYIYPPFSTVFGVITIFLSVLSIMGALGGFFVGTILGILGGALAIGWKPVMISSKSDREWGRKAKTLDGGKQSREGIYYGDVLESVGSTRVVNDDEREIAASRDVEESERKSKKQTKTKSQDREQILEETSSTRILYGDKPDRKRNA